MRTGKKKPSKHLLCCDGFFFICYNIKTRHSGRVFIMIMLKGGRRLISLDLQFLIDKYSLTLDQDES